MRPQTLRVAGLRSYRTERILDFSDRSLIAILGDTGSGKSSLLEALYGALYGASTWDARGLGALIADGAKTLQVELTFTSRGRSYTVSRSVSRDNYPPSKHILDGDDGEHVEGERNVNPRIAEIVGLSDQEFLRVVVLPQGRFGALLQGTAGERTPILRGILGLGVLDDVREVADRQAGELADALEPLISARARLYPDPSAVAAQAQLDSQEHHLRFQQLEEVSGRLASIDGATKQVEQALPAVSGALARVDGIDLDPVIASLDHAEAAESRLRSEITELQESRAKLVIDQTKLAGLLAEAKDEGVTPESLARAGSDLEFFVGAMPGLQTRASQQTEVELSVSALTDLLGSQKGVVEAHGNQVTAARDKLQLATDAARAADEAVREARTHWNEIESLCERLERESNSLQDSVQGLAASCLRAASIAPRISDIEAEIVALSAKLDKLRADNLAAHVAANCLPGENCPVCSQELPASFEPRSIEGEEQVVEDLDGHLQACESLKQEQRDEERTKDRARSQVLNDVNRLLDTYTEVRNHYVRLRSESESVPSSVATLPQISPTDLEGYVDEFIHGLAESRAQSAPDVVEQLCARLIEIATAREAESLDQAGGSKSGESSLEPYVSRSAIAHALLEEETERTDALARDGAAAIAAFQAQTSELERAQADSARLSGEIADAARQIASRLLAMPDFLQQRALAALELRADNLSASSLSSAVLPDASGEELFGSLASRVDELAAWRTAHDEAVLGISVLDGDIAQRNATRRDEVDAPRGTTRVQLERASGALTSLAESLPTLREAWRALVECADLEALPPLEFREATVLAAEVPDLELGPQSRALAESLTTARSSGRAIEIAAANGVAVARESVQGALSGVDVSDVSALRDELATATHRKNEANARLVRAEAQVELAHGLDKGTGTLKARLTVLRVIKDLMSPAGFPNFVITQRQTALLRIASSLLARLTRDSYGFAEDFMIVDRRTGQPRHAKTLSGGEAFLASLALALALVEISNRSGGQLDALFLDEGFGSLDAAFLGDALDVLRDQASGGRLVGVISHLHAVASEIDDVLVVTKEVTGSDLRWLDAESREQFLLDEAAAGLLT
jgi:exonuclease SbcC